MKVFIKPGCPWCHEAVEYLNKGGFEFEAVDVIADRVAYDEMRELSGQTKTPTLVTDDDEVLADFGVDELVPFLEEQGITP